MAKQDVDCITLDLFSNVAKVGRPKTNPLSREQQIRINKRNQLKLHKDLVQQLENLAAMVQTSRAEFIEQVLQDYIKTQKTGN